MVFLPVKKIVTIITYLLISGFALSVSAAAQTIVDTQPLPSAAALASQQYIRTMGDVASLLGWTPAPNLCRGFYLEPASITAVPKAAPLGTSEITITANQPSLLSQTGTSMLQGNVTVTQPGREVMADQAYIYRDPATQKPNRV